jgi:hypothetical protein
MAGAWVDLQSIRIVRISKFTRGHAGPRHLNDSLQVDYDRPYNRIGITT